MNALVLPLVLPLAAAAVVSLLGRFPNAREAVTLMAALALVLSVLWLGHAGAGSLTLAEPLPGLSIAFAIEPLGLMFAGIASVLWLISSIYCIGYLRGNGETHQTRFYACFALAIGAAVGIALAANAFTLFFCYEALTLVTYPLVTHHGTDEARRAGRVYLGFLLGTSIVLLLPALIFTWFIAGTTDFASGGILPADLDRGVLAVLLGLYMFGIGKAALMPFHRWLPAAMVAPAPVSALLHAVAVVKAGVFTVVKVLVYIFGIDTLAGATDWLVAVAGFTILAASLVALRADNLKRRLAYSTVSQLSYVVLAAALLAPLSIMGAVLHIAAHAFGKITLFLAAGSIYTAAHKTEVSQLDGIGRRMPWTMGAFAIGALSMIGLPPAAGFVSKWYMVSGAADGGHWGALAVISLSTLLTAGYFAPIVHRAFLRAPAAGDEPHGEAPLPIVIALVLTAGATVALFFLPDALLVLARSVVES